MNMILHRPPHGRPVAQAVQPPALFCTADRYRLDAKIGSAIGAKPDFAAVASCSPGSPGRHAHDATGMDDGPGRGRGVLPGLVGQHPAADPPGGAGPGRVSADPRSRRHPHPPPRPAGPCRSRTGAAAGHLRLQLHPDQPGRLRPGQGGGRRALRTVTAPRWRTSSATASSAPPSGTSPPDTPRSTWPGCGERCIRRDHGRLAAPASPPSPPAPTCSPGTACAAARP